MEDINAMVHGAVEGGATDILINEAHNTMINIDARRLDPRVKFLSGFLKDIQHMTTLDSSFDAAFLFTHAMAGSKEGVLSHTLVGGIDSVRLNGTLVGEMGLNAALAGYYGVPVALVVGDEAVCQESRELLGDSVVNVATKKGVERFAAVCLTPAESQRLIREGSEEAVRRCKKIKPFIVESPIELELRFSNTSVATVCSWIPHVELIDPKTIVIRHDDLKAASNVVVVCTLLTVSPWVTGGGY